MHNFDFKKPSSVTELTAMMTSYGRDARLLAGGTDLIVGMRSGNLRPAVVIDAKKIPTMVEIKLEHDGLTLGAATSCRRIWENRQVADIYPALIDSASLIGGTSIQGRASVGGNLCNASPSADSVPTLIVMRAVATIVSSRGTRTLPVKDFCLGPRKNVLADDELLLQLHLPPPPKHSGGAFNRFIPRNEMDIAVVNAAAEVELDASHTRFVDVRIAIGAVAPTPLFVSEAGNAIKNKPVNRETIDHAGDVAMSCAKPISDLRGTADQRRDLTRIMTIRALEKAVRRAGGTVTDD